MADRRVTIVDGVFCLQAFADYIARWRDGPTPVPAATIEVRNQVSTALASELRPPPEYGPPPGYPDTPVPAASERPTEFHPVQTHAADREDSQIPASVTLRAYEVYCHLFGPQPAMVDLLGRNCRGGFAVGELLAFLYARSFPRDEWRARFHEACERPKP